MRYLNIKSWLTFARRKNYCLVCNTICRSFVACRLLVLLAVKLSRLHATPRRSLRSQCAYKCLWLVSALLDVLFAAYRQRGRVGWQVRPRRLRYYVYAHICGVSNRLSRSCVVRERVRTTAERRGGAVTILPHVLYDRFLFAFFLFTPHLFK